MNRLLFEDLWTQNKWPYEYTLTAIRAMACTMTSVKIPKIIAQLCAWKMWLHVMKSKMAVLLSEFDLQNFVDKEVGMVMKLTQIVAWHDRLKCFTLQLFSSEVHVNTLYEYLRPSLLDISWTSVSYVTSSRSSFTTTTTTYTAFVRFFILFWHSGLRLKHRSLMISIKNTWLQSILDDTKYEYVAI